MRDDFFSKSILPLAAFAVIVGVISATMVVFGLVSKPPVEEPRSPAESGQEPFSQPQPFPPPVPLPSMSRPYQQFGTLTNLAPGMLAVRQTAGSQMVYAIHTGTVYFRCDQAMRHDDLRLGERIVVLYTLPGNNERRATAVYLDADCGDETTPVRLAQEAYVSDFGPASHFQIVSGTANGVLPGRFDLLQPSGEIFSATYGVDTIFFRCAMPREFALAEGMTISVSFVAGIKPIDGVTYVAAIEVLSSC